ncbi:hypothetical protein C9J27_05560 [Photobacterium kishitanii]|uniref:Uncharacterized protein n=1 Tax=Photobacterium kishitanii TaxID=318456 RepID=A0A2T3KLQ8_9GAMM|nr:hypothetical protein C9J27_05560 [Photobacterium kishitanii]
MFYSKKIVLQEKKIKRAKYVSQKLKMQYADTYIESLMSVRFKLDGSAVVSCSTSSKYPRIHSWTFKHFSMKQEASFYQMHQIEYSREYGHFLRSSRSSSSLPDCNDDYCSHVFDQVKGWKFNSKRRKQYYK